MDAYTETLDTQRLLTEEQQFKVNICLQY